ncbi:uncharacterized protein K02A2.6-like [Pecten maximus]|uniref:uncharacterized protein K02A2.6-like n=1 Tax=Pecten maximus TaxID=6579 RepID=UPI0014587198|nr:uncharacterized protein K02A2.6-like [Pecten maximus]
MRLCVDMRQANTAIIRERHPIPTVDEVIHDLNQSTVFNKLDLKWAFHQIELSEASRPITTFVTHKGLYRYKRLMFGISCTPEMYQRIKQALHGCTGVRNIFDDIIVHGKTKQELDENLEGLFVRLREKGLTLNDDNCKLNLQELEFMGHILSSKGISPEDRDASPVDTVLTQVQNGENRIICYASRSLTDVERRYTQTEKEALGIVWACERFRNIADSLSRLTKIGGNLESDTASDSGSYIRLVAQHSCTNALSTREIERESAKDPELTRVREHLRNNNWKKNEKKAYQLIKDELCVVGKLILRGTRIVFPESLREQVLKLAHEGHPGIVAAKRRVRTKVWWPGIDRDVERYCRTCRSCQIVGLPPPPEPVQSTDLPSGPWQQIAVDLMGPLPSGDFLFVVVDYHSRYFEVEVIKSTTTDNIIKRLKKIFLTHGLPVQISTDNGPQFGDQFTIYLAGENISHRKTTPLWPQANGEVERQNHSLMKRLKIAQVEKRDWREDCLII